MKLKLWQKILCLVLAIALLAGSAFTIVYYLMQ